MFCQDIVESDKFIRVERIVNMPPVPTTITIQAGISQIGEVWFDDLFVEEIR